MPSECFLRDIGDGNGPDDDADLSGIVWMAYDELYLYLYAEVKDDVVNGSNGARYLNDCIELKFDPEPDEGGNYTAGLNTRLTVLGDASIGGIDNLTGLPDYVPVDGEDYARKITGDGYALEFRLPIENMNTSDGRWLSFNTSGQMGLAINIGDNDVGQRDNMLQWSAGHSDAVHSDPRLLGAVTFLDNHKLGFEAVSIIDPSIVNENADDWYSNPNPSGVSDASVEVESYKLFGNYPNPFNPSTTVKFTLPKNNLVSLEVYNVTGEKVTNLIDRSMDAGSHTITWDSTDDFGHSVPNGIYLCKIQAGTYHNVIRMLLIK
ncbi:sugar-binding protein [bacterium]